METGVPVIPAGWAVIAADNCHEVKRQSTHHRQLRPDPTSAHTNI